MGPVHALIALAGERAAVTLWAEREASAAHLRANGSVLQDALRAAALEPRDIQVRVGAPAAPPPAAGRFLDRAS
jgi:Flagellar hook-length control protein FliK